MKKNKKGFTLIEIIVVVVILAVLMAVAVPSVMKYIDEADDAKYMTQARGAYTTAQIELSKAYINSKDTSIEPDVQYAGAFQQAVDNLANTSPIVEQISGYKSEDQTTPIAYGDDPELIKLYLVVFEDGKIVYFYPNGTVKIMN